MTEILTIDAFARARHELWLERQYGLETDNPDVEVLRPFHYTNLWRETDRASVFLFNEIQQPTESFYGTILFTAAFRTFNKVETWKTLVDNWEFIGTPEAMFMALKAQGKAFTGAYVRCPDLMTVCRMLAVQLPGVAMNASHYLADGDMQGLWKELRTLYSFGDFLTDQLVMDLDWTGSKVGYRGFAPKWGPGAKRGMAVALEQYKTEYKTEILRRVGLAIPLDWRPQFNGMPVGFGDRELEHTACEYFKHVKHAQRGDSRVKMRTYVPQKAPAGLPWSWQEPQIIKEQTHAA